MSSVIIQVNLRKGAWFDWDYSTTAYVEREYCLYDLLLPLNFRLCFFSTCDLEDSLRFCFNFFLLLISCCRIITNYQQFGQLEPLFFLSLPWAFSICFTILSGAENSIPQNLQVVPVITISLFLLKKFIILNDKLFTIKC